MKYLAHIDKSLNSRIISIYDVIQGLNGDTPQEWEERTYYSLWYNTPMIAKVNSVKQRPHFAFKKGFGGNENSGGGESLEHQLSKKVITDLKSLRIKIGDIEDTLLFSEMIIEQPFKNSKYQADLYCKIANSNKFNFQVDSMIVIELHRTNKVTKSKQRFYRDNNIAAIEVDIYKEIKYKGNIEQLQKELIGYFKRKRFAKRLHDPNWKKIIQEKKKSVQREELATQSSEPLNFQEESPSEQHQNQTGEKQIDNSNVVSTQYKSNLNNRKSFFGWILSFFRKCT